MLQKDMPLQGMYSFVLPRSIDAIALKCGASRGLANARSPKYRILRGFMGARSLKLLDAVTAEGKLMKVSRFMATDGCNVKEVLCMFGEDS